MPKWTFGVLQLSDKINLLSYVPRVSREYSKSCYGEGCYIFLNLTRYQSKSSDRLALLIPSELEFAPI